MFEIVIDVAVVSFATYAGMKIQQSYPNVIPSIKSVFSGIINIYTWLKGLSGKL